jgi:hypothetical protein
MKRISLVLMSASLINFTAIADSTFDQSLLAGSWCYKSITAKGSSRAKEVETDWVFLGDGKVEMQSEWMKNIRNTLPYTIERNRIKIPKANKTFEVSELTEREMLLINVLGNSNNRFVKWECN